MSRAIAAAKTSLGSVLRRTGATAAMRARLRKALAARGIQARVGGLRRRRRGRGITATELRGFRKVANLLNRYFRTAPAAMKRRGFGRKR